VDRWRETDIWKSHVMLTGVSGIHATPVSEFVLAHMLMLAKNAQLGFRMKQTRRWHRYPSTLLRGKTLGIVGLGRIGREVARLSKRFGMKVLATRRSTMIPITARNVASVMPQSYLKQMLAIIGEAELNVMKPTAYLINIGRGQLIDEPALIRALEKKIIAGAGLDVTYTEPLPKESPLWDLNNVILSPHISGGMDDYMLRATEVFCANLQRYLRGGYLLNVVERKRGY
jgi:phosphoglycerate dehydrogenase-like enzyme